DKEKILIVRFFNPSDKEVISTIKFGFPVQSIWMTNLNEEAIEKISEKEQTVEIKIKAKKIITLAIEFI
ncbi:MAG: glycosyl hydrolase-related protein, partial [Candidatus Hydrogenedens sp.]